MRKLKLALYWLSLIPPIVDIVRGAILGVQKGLAEIKAGHTLESDKQESAFREANTGD